MRRRPRLAVAVLLLASLVATGCAELDDDEFAAMLNETVDEEFTNRPPGLGEDPDAGPGAGPDATAPVEDPMATTASIDRGDAIRPEIHRIVCPFDTDALTEVRCGEVEVPGRGVDDDYRVTIAFARFFATGDAEDVEPDPVVYLHGGPGGAVLADADYWYDTIVAPHVEHRDVILYDQRGGGESTTVPLCHEARDVEDRVYFEAVPNDALRDEFIEALGACATKFVERTDVDLTAFDSLTNARDLSDLLWALDVSTYDLHGSSYGTRLAQTMMREFPQGVRSVVLSGTYPIEENLMGSIPVSLETAVDAVFEACAADEACTAALPDPWGALQQLVAELDARPLLVEVADTLDSTVTLAFDGTDFLNGVHQMFYVGRGAVELPDLLIDHLDGDDDRIRRLARYSIFDVTDSATFVLVQCADEAPFTTPADLDRPLRHEFLRAIDGVPALNGTDSLEICGLWDTGATDPVENEPVAWDAPTLLLAGSVDPITPAPWAASMARRLPDARLVVFPDRGHDADEGWCALDLITAFVEDPRRDLDAACAAGGELVVDTMARRFRQPTGFEPLELRLDGRDGVVRLDVPDWLGDWRDDRHLRWRDLDELDQTALVIGPADDDYPIVEHLGFFGDRLDWTDRPRSDTPAGWDREVAPTAAGDVVRLTNRQADLAVTLVLEPDESEDLEGRILVPTVASIELS